MKNKYLSRRSWLALALGGATTAAGAGYAKMLEPGQFEITRKRVLMRGINQPVRLLHLSDFHASKDVPYSQIQQAIELGLELTPDFAVLTGDFITWRLESPQRFAQILRRLSDKMPVFACLGNHDGGRWAGSTAGQKTAAEVATMLDDAGVHLLVNRAHHLQLNESPLKIVGLGDLWNDDARPQGLLPPTDLALPKDEPATILLAHNPDTKDEIKQYYWDLMCCGHTHGGQLVVPLLGWRPFLPVRDASMPEGLHYYTDGRQIHVTRGVGNLHGVRFNCPPEISLLQLLPQREEILRDS